MDVKRAEVGDPWENEVHGPALLPDACPELAGLPRCQNFSLPTTTLSHPYPYQYFHLIDCLAAFVIFAYRQDPFLKSPPAPCRL